MMLKYFLPFLAVLALVPAQDYHYQDSMHYIDCKFKEVKLLDYKYHVSFKNFKNWYEANVACYVCFGTRLADIPNEVVRSVVGDNEVFVGSYDGGLVTKNLVWNTTYGWQTVIVQDDDKPRKGLCGYVSDDSKYDRYPTGAYYPPHYSDHEYTSDGYYPSYGQRRDNRRYEDDEDKSGRRYREDDRRDDGYGKDRRDDGYGRDRRDDGYGKDRRDDGYGKDRRDDGYGKDRRDDGYGKDRRDDGYDRDRHDDGYDRDRHDDGYDRDRHDDGYDRDRHDDRYGRDRHDDEYGDRDDYGDRPHRRDHRDEYGYKRMDDRHERRPRSRYGHYDHVDVKL